MDQMLARLPARMLAEWMAYYTIEPFGVERGDLQAGLVAAAIYNVHRDPKRRRQPFTPADFLLEFPPEEEIAAAADDRSVFEKLKRALGLTASRAQMEKDRPFEE